MMPRSRYWARQLALPLRQCLGAIAIFAQFLVVIAPLADAREGAPLPASVASIAELGNSHVAVHSDHGHQTRHDAATCPACIAQSLVAHVAAPTRVPAPESGERTRREHSDIRVLKALYLSFQQSRAPPSAS